MKISLKDGILESITVSLLGEAPETSLTLEKMAGGGGGMMEDEKLGGACEGAYKWARLEGGIRVRREKGGRVKEGGGEKKGKVNVGNM